MRLLKLSEEHYILADKLDIKVGDWITDRYFVYQWRDNSSLLGRMKVTHCTEPHEQYYGASDGTIPYVYHKINPLSLSEVKELLGVVDVATKAAELAYSRRIKYQDPFHDGVCSGLEEGYGIGYSQALKDNKKKYTEEDLRNAISFGNNIQYTKLAISGVEKEMSKFIQSLQPKTEWDVEIIDNKLKLK